MPLIDGKTGHCATCKRLNWDHYRVKMLIEDNKQLERLEAEQKKKPKPKKKKKKNNEPNTEKVREWNVSLSKVRRDEQERERYLNDMAECDDDEDIKLVEPATPIATEHDRLLVREYKKHAKLTRKREEKRRQRKVNKTLEAHKKLKKERGRKMDEDTIKRFELYH